MNNTNDLSSKEQQGLLARKAAKEHLIDFCITVDPTYDPQWFHREIAVQLESVYERVQKGESPRLMIFMPPRHGKSDESTQKFPAWVLGKSPELPIIVASYASDLATKFGQATRDLVNSNNYQTVFKTRLRDDTQAKTHWMTDDKSNKGGYEAVGIGGPITGKGFKIGIIDDPIKNFEEADSELVRENVHQWYKSTFYTRQEGNAAIIVILTRWHDDDLAGRLIKEQEQAQEQGEVDYDKWEIINYEAVAEYDEKYRKAGEPLWPGKFNLQKLAVIKKTLGPYLWSALYQQNPITNLTQEFRDDWFKQRNWSAVERLITRKFVTIDTALGKKRTIRQSQVETKSSPDYTGVTRNYVDLGNNWNIKSKRYEINSAGLVDLIFDLHLEGFEVIGIEETAYTEAIEPFLKAEMNKRGLYPNVQPLKHGGTMKESRIRGLIPKYSCGEVYHIIGECEDLEKELRRFPKGAHDDCMDSEAYQIQIAERPVAEDKEAAGLYQSTFD